MNPVRKIRRGAWMLLLISAVCPASFSLGSHPAIEQFAHTAWGQKEGAPQQITAITQTEDGYLWLGSPKGLFRFDGITFDRYQPQSGPKLPATSAESLLALANGDLWIGYSSGEISLLRNGRAENYTGRNGVPDVPIRSLAQDKEGTIWAGSLSELVRFKGNRWEKIGREWNFSGKTDRALFIDRKGTVWVAPQDSSVVFLPQGSTAFQTTSVRVSRVGDIAEAPNGKLWMAETSRGVRPIPLGVELPPADTAEIQVGSVKILFSQTGDLWITTLGDGLRHVPVPEQVRGKYSEFSSAIESFTTKNGLTDNYVSTIFQDHQGNVWVGTLSGVDRFQMGGFVPVSLPFWDGNAKLVPGSSGDLWVFSYSRVFHVGQSRVNEIKGPGSHEILAAYRDPKGAIWLISAEPALIRFEDGRFSRFPPPKELSKPFSQSVRITEDGSGTLWMAAYRQGLFRRDGDTWSRFDTPAEVSNLLPITAFTDSLGRAWFAYAGGWVIYIDGGKIHTVFTRENSPVGTVGVIDGRNRHVWLGGSSGLLFVDGDKFHQVVPIDRPNFEHIYGTEELADGSLWICEENGVIRIAPAEILKFLERPSYRVQYEIFDSLGSVPGLFEHSGARLVEGADGRIWFGGDHGIAWLSPATIPHRVPPPVSIRSLIAADKQFSLEPGLMLPARSQKLEIDYTALNLSTPERARYRYKLDGLDNDWQDAGVRRQAFYTNLGPGKYRFHMTARNEGGEWNTAEAELDFSISPAWFQTIWFRSLCACVFLFLPWMLYHLRLRQLERQFNRTLEARVSERTRIARELHDTLLQTFSASLLRFQSVSKMLPARPDEAKLRVDTAIEQASSAIAEGRDAVHQLRAGASTDVDLVQSIGNFVGELAGSSGENLPEFRLQVEGTPRDLDPLLSDEAYRIAAEALRNAVRYAGARQIEVEIRYDEQQLRLRIRDDGKGIAPGVLEQGYASGHWGLRGMRERAKLLGGNFEVWSQSGSGTEIELTVPAARAYARPASRWSILLKSWRN